MCRPLPGLGFIGRFAIPHRQFGRKKGETADRYAVRAWSRFNCFAFTVAGFPMAWLMHMADPTVGVRIGLVHTLTVVLTLTTYLFPAFGMAVHDLLSALGGGHRPSLRVVIRSMLLSLVLFSIGSMFLLVMKMYGMYENAHLYIFLALALFAPLFIGIGFWGMALEVRRYDEWGPLDIAE